jgi:putative proteasome-type protease
MTYCLGIKLKSGLVALADTRITSGNETTMAKKIFVYQKPKRSMFIMTSGLRSVRDKALTYFKETLAEQDGHFNKLYKAVNAFAQELRVVADEDKPSLSASGYQFNLHAIVGGQMEDDTEPKLYRLYPEGNWVEIGENTPFVIIGNTGYGKPILDRVLKYESTMPFAVKTGFLSFDSTRISANDVDFPADLVLYERDSFHLSEYRFQREEVRGLSETWASILSNAIHQIPDDWTDKVFPKKPTTSQ